MNEVLRLLAWWGAAMLNSLVPGLLLGLLGWAALKTASRLNSSTRFALGFSLLLAVALLPVLLSIPLGRGAMDTVAATVRPLHGSAASMAWPGWLETVAALVWLSVSLLLAVRLCAACRDLSLLRRSCRPADDGLIAALNLSGQGRARICLSDAVSSPLAMGFWRPIVVLPSAMPRQAEPADLRRVLLHELEHVRRGDHWTHVLQQILMAALFFQPAAWWLNGFLTEEREAACDDAVLAATGEARGYAACLARLAETGLERRMPAWAAGAISRPSLLRRRVMRILQNGRDVSNRLSRPAMVASLAAVAVVLTAAARLPRLVLPQPVAWPESAALPSLHPQWEAQRTQAATAIAKARVDAEAVASLRHNARLVATGVAAPKPHAVLVADATGRSRALLREPRNHGAVSTPVASAWRIVEVQRVQWNRQGQVTATRMVFVVTGPQALRLLQNPPPVFF